MPEVKFVQPLLLGIATGIRSTLALDYLALTPQRRTPIGVRWLPGVSAPSPWTPRRRAVAAIATAAVAGELVADKLPKTPSRLELPGLVARLAIGATSAALAARRRPVDATAIATAAALGLVGAGISSVGGTRWRGFAAKKFGKDLPGALIEDAVGLALAGYLAATNR